MRRLKKNYYLSLFCIVVAILGLVRLLTDAGSTQDEIQLVAEAAQEHSREQPQNTGGSTASDMEVIQTSQPQNLEDKSDTTPATEDETDSANTSIENEGTPPDPDAKKADKNNQNRGHHPHPIYSVPSFRRTFPDLQDVHAASASKWGVKPVRNREAAEKRKDELVYIGSNPYYKIDPGMNMSIPYLVPRAAKALETIARNYLDSLHIKGIPLHKILVSSVLRTEEDISKLRKVNVNASVESCHRYGTTFDIPYNRYHTVMPPDQNRRTVQNDTLKWILAEVLRDVRQQGLCHIKYEVKQGCFHITAR